MNVPAGDDQDGGLPPAGRRWGAGAHSVLPYLTKSLQAKPTSAIEARDAGPREAERAGPNDAIARRPAG